MLPDSSTKALNSLIESRKASPLVVCPEDLPKLACKSMPVIRHSQSIAHSQEAYLSLKLKQKWN